MCRCMVRSVGDKGGASSITTHIGLVCAGSCVTRHIVNKLLVDPYLFLDARLDILLRFTHVEAITIISITQIFVHVSGSLARELFATVGPLSIDFILPWTVARTRTEVCINTSSLGVRAYP